MTIGDVTVGHVCGGHQCLIGDGDTVVAFVLVANALQDLDGVGNRGLVDLDGLEATLECGVFLEVLSVFIECGCTNGLKFAACQHRLEN